MSRTKKIVLGLIIVIAAVLGIGIWTLFWTGSTKDVEAVADKFHPPSAWTLVDEQVEPPRMVCLGDVPCPQVTRTWKGDSEISYGDLKKMLADAGWDFAIQGDCTLSDNASGNVSLCHASGNVDGFGVYVDYYTQIAHKDRSRLDIIVNENRK